VVTEADPDGAGPLAAPVTRFTYDARGNLISSVDAGSSQTRNQTSFPAFQLPKAGHTLRL